MSARQLLGIFVALVVSEPLFCINCRWCEETRDTESGCGHPKVAWANKYFRVTGKAENGCYAADEYATSARSCIVSPPPRGMTIAMNSNQPKRCTLAP